MEARRGQAATHRTGPAPGRDPGGGAPGYRTRTPVPAAGRAHLAANCVLMPGSPPVLGHTHPRPAPSGLAPALHTTWGYSAPSWLPRGPAPSPGRQDVPGWDSETSPSLGPPSLPTLQGPGSHGTGPQSRGVARCLFPRPSPNTTGQAPELLPSAGAQSPSFPLQPLNAPAHLSRTRSPAPGRLEACKSPTQL